MTKRRGGVTYPSAASRADSSPYTPPGPSVYVSFAGLPDQDPLSASGVFSNNTQGVGGNGAPLTGTSVRVVSGRAVGSIAAQINYEDSFAFVPGVAPTGNQRAMATVYRDAGYAPSDNHEVQIILGCATAASYHRWGECLWSLGGLQDTINQDGNFDGDGFDSGLGVGTGNVSGGPLNADVFVGELYRSANRIRWGVIRGGVTLAALAAMSASARQAAITAGVVWAQDTTNALFAGLGGGAGIAVFRRPSPAGDAESPRLGFSDFFAEGFA